MLNTVVFILMGLGLAVGSVLHGMLFILLVAGGVHFSGVLIRRSATGGAFPGGCMVRHAKLALPALGVLAADAAVAYVAVHSIGA
ncbi:hypothetical protein ACI3L3_12560 [Desulfobaculum sp. SPO524]|uniref:hypothetical protein n=1 Tax=Desulfobaculum sp. SPO524 TaxID=3378071 RepID=UPI00385322F5